MFLEKLKMVSPAQHLTRPVIHSVQEDLVQVPSLPLLNDWLRPGPCWDLN
jgi:hypothetical protein